MTTILGLRSGGVSYLAADSRICAGDPLPAQIMKIAVRGTWAIGGNGPSAIINLLHDANGEPGASPKELARWLRDGLMAADWKPANEPGAADYGTWSLVAASADGIYDVCSNLSYCRIDDGEPWARGSGMEYARASAAAFLAMGVGPESAIHETFKIVSRFDPGTDDRVQLVRIGNAVDQQHCDPRDFGIDENGCLEGTTLRVLTSLPRQDDDDTAARVLRLGLSGSSARGRSMS